MKNETQKCHRVTAIWRGVAWERCLRCAGLCELTARERERDKNDAIQCAYILTLLSDAE